MAVDREIWVVEMTSHIEKRRYQKVSVMNLLVSGESVEGAEENDACENLLDRRGDHVDSGARDF